MSRWTATAAISFVVAIALTIRVAAHGAGPEPASAGPSADTTTAPPEIRCSALQRSNDVQALLDATEAKRLPGTRRCAAERLAELHSDAATARLRELADDPDTDVAGAALRALARHPSESARSFVAERAATSVAALIAMAEAHAPDAAARIIAALPRQHAMRSRRKLVAALGETGDGAAVMVLTELLADGEVRTAAVQALGRIGGPKARPVLERLLEEAPDRDLGTILPGLARYPDGQALLLRKLASRRKALRDAAAETLRDMDTPGVRELMLRELDARQPESAEMALSYYADAVDPRAIPSLSRLSRDARPTIAAVAVSALLAQGPDAFAELAALVRENREPAARVLEVAGDTLLLRPALRAAALRRLREGSVRAGPVLDYLAGDLSREALDALVDAARLSHQPAQALQAIAARGDTAALDALGRLSAFHDVDLSRAAARTLAGCADARATGALVRASGSSDASVRREAIGTLLRIGAREGTRALDASLASSDAEDRAQAVRWLIQFGPPRPGPKLEALTADHDASIARTALLELSEVDRGRAVAIAREKLRADPGDQAAMFVLRTDGDTER